MVRRIVQPQCICFWKLKVPSLYPHTQTNAATDWILFILLDGRIAKDDLQSITNTSQNKTTSASSFEIPLTQPVDRIKRNQLRLVLRRNTVIHVDTCFQNERSVCQLHAGRRNWKQCPQEVEYSVNIREFTHVPIDVVLNCLNTTKFNRQFQ